MHSRIVPQTTYALIAIGDRNRVVLERVTHETVRAVGAHVIQVRENHRCAPYICVGRVRALEEDCTAWVALRSARGAVALYLAANEDLCGGTGCAKQSTLLKDA